MRWWNSRITQAWYIATVFAINYNNYGVQTLDFCRYRQYVYEENGMKGCAYGIGVGPGDPELMTLKAVRILKEADVIAYSGQVPEDCTAYRIAVQSVPEIADKEMLPIAVPMTYDRQQQELEHNRTARRIGEYLDAGKNVACLTLGDPTIYSSFSYYRLILEKNGYRTETISAVPSFCAAAAKLNIPLAEWEEPVHIIPAVHQTEQDLELPGTCVYMKIGRQLKALKEAVDKPGLEVHLAENCGMEGEKMYHGIDTIPDSSGYFTTMIVKHSRGSHGNVDPGTTDTPVTACASPSPVQILQIGSAACTPCTAIRQRIERWIDDHPMVSYRYISIDDHPVTAAQYGIFSVPAVLVFVEGSLTIKESGYFSLDDVLVRTERYLSFLPYCIRRAVPDDIPAVTAIYEAVLREEELGNYTIGWARGVYPTEETARTAIAGKELFVLEEDGKILASARINHEQMPAYASVSWSVEVPDEQVMVMHTLTVDPAMNGHGAGTHFLQFYEYYSMQNGSHVLRIDTNARNVNARRKYAAAGYTECGIIPCEFNGIPDVQLVCMEKVLSRE